MAVEDQGLPFDYTRFQHGEDRTLPEMLHRSFADEVRFVNLGRRGNRVELIKQEEEHRATLSAPAAPENVPLEIRTMRPEESFELSRCVYRSYGYSYDWELIFRQKNPLT